MKLKLPEFMEFRKNMGDKKLPDIVMPIYNPLIKPKLEKISG